MQGNIEQIIVIYSTKGTKEKDINTAIQTIDNYEHAARIKFKCKKFEVPMGSQPGETLNSELYSELTASIGAIVFVDDLRPNVIYELGFLHGQGRIVLLVTKSEVESNWSKLSDLAGASFAVLENIDLKTAIHSYLGKTIIQMGNIDTLKSFPNMSKDNNLLNKLPEFKSNNGPYGSMLRIESWKEMDIRLGINLFSDARFLLLLRGINIESKYTLYFRLSYTDRNSIKRTTWIGFTSRKSIGGVTWSERMLPGQDISKNWRIFGEEFQRLLRRGHVLNIKSVDYLETIRFRAGMGPKYQAYPYEIGYFGIFGMDE